MNSNLTIYFPQLPRDLADVSAADLPCDVQIDDQPWQNCSLQQLSQQLANAESRPDFTHLEVYLPGINVLASEVRAPRKQHKHLARILPFLCEEQLAADIDSLHIVPGRIQGDSVAICAVNKRQLEKLLSLLSECQLAPTLVAAETDLLRGVLKPGQSLLWIDQHHCHLSIAQQAVSLDRAQLKYALEILQQQADQALLLCFDKANAAAEITLAVEDMKARGIEVSEQQLDHPELSTLQQLAQLPLADNSKSAVINLLHGPYARKNSSSSAAKWRPAVAAAAVFVALNLIYLLASGMYFSRQANLLHGESENLYRSYFPDDQRIINIKTQTQGHLNRAQGYSQSGFLHMLQQFILPWGEYRNQLTLKSLRFNQQRNELLLDIESRSIEQLDKLQSSLGEQAELLSASEDGSGVRGRIKLQGGRP